MHSLYGPRQSFPTRRAAEAFLRHVTRELTAGGLPHWVEVQETTEASFLAYVHRFACPGGPSCSCAQDEADDQAPSVSAEPNCHNSRDG